MTSFRELSETENDEVRADVRGGIAMRCAMLRSTVLYVW